MPPFLAELLGTMLLVILGDGVVANVVLNKTKGQSGGWIVITAGWAFAVTVAVYAVGPFTGGRGHPPGTLSLASMGRVAWGAGPGYFGGPVVGGRLGGAAGWGAHPPPLAPP